MKKILQILRNTDQGIPKYVLRAWMIDFIPTILIAAAFAATRMPGPPASDEPIWQTVVSGVVVCPVVETLMLWLFVRLLMLFLKDTVSIAVGSAIIFGILHGMYSVKLGFTVLWGFFVMSLCFLEWRKRSLSSAIIVTSLIHGLFNLAVAILAFIAVGFVLLTQH
jgi:hypothetical protein